MMSRAERKRAEKVLQIEYAIALSDRGPIITRNGVPADLAHLVNVINTSAEYIRTMDKREATAKLLYLAGLQAEKDRDAALARVAELEALIGGSADDPANQRARVLPPGSETLPHE